MDGDASDADAAVAQRQEQYDLGTIDWHEVDASGTPDETLARVASYAYAGQLISYGPNLHASWKRLAHYADRIIKGANPAELPVEMPAVLELVVNLKTAKALGVKVPHTILLRADRVIE